MKLWIFAGFYTLFFKYIYVSSSEPLYKSKNLKNVDKNF